MPRCGDGVVKKSSYNCIYDELFSKAHSTNFAMQNRPFECMLLPFLETSYSNIYITSTSRKDILILHMMVHECRNCEYYTTLSEFPIESFVKLGI